MKEDFNISKDKIRVSMIRMMEKIQLGEDFTKMH